MLGQTIADTNSDTAVKRWLIAIFFFVFPAIVYCALVTKGSFDLLAPSYGWQTYNEYAEALINGHLWVPAEAIGAEGLYIKGRVYLYYGMLPALLRLPLVPFIDLDRTSLSPLMTWAMTVIGTGALQIAILRVVGRREAPDRFDPLLLVVASFILWFSSAALLLVQDASFYHEPHAAAWMLAGIFIAMLADDLLVTERPPTALRLVAYATLAGLAVYAKQTFAVGLYVAVLALLLPSWAALRAAPWAALRARLAVAVLPLWIMLVAGIAYVGMGYVRLGRIGTGWDVAHYGFYIIGKRAWRFETMIHQQFSLARIPPGLLHFIAGGNTRRSLMIEQLGGGRVLSFDPAIRHYVFAPMALLLAATGGALLFRQFKRSPLALQLFGVTLGLLLIALLQLAYATYQYRYVAEIWPLLLWLILVALRHRPVSAIAQLPLPLAAASVVALALALVSVDYSMRLRPKLAEDHPRGPGSLWAPLPPKLIALATAPGSRDPTIILGAPAGYVPLDGRPIGAAGVAEDFAP